MGPNEIGKIHPIMRVWFSGIPTMNLWQQNYDPAGNIWLPADRIAPNPVLLFALIKLKLKGCICRFVDDGYRARRRAAVLL